MSVNREAIYAAVLSLFQAKLASNFTTIGRRHRAPPKDLTSAQQPALFICEAQEQTVPKPPGTSGKKTLRALLFVYAWIPGLIEAAGAETVIPGAVINGLLQNIDDALAPSGSSQPWAPQNVQTLGGLVSHCWIEGDTDIDPAIFGQQAVAVIPLHILVP